MVTIKTLNQPSNQLRLLQSNFTNLSRTIGNLFIPIITQLLPYLNGLVIALQRLFTWIGNVLGIDLSGIGTSIGSSAVDMSQLADETEDATDNLKELQKEAKKTTLGFDQLNILGSNEDEDKNKEQDPSAITAALEGALNDAISQYQKVWDEAFSNMENKAIEIADKIQEAFSGVKLAIDLGDFEMLGEELANLINTGLQKVYDAIGWDNVGPKITEFTNAFTQTFNSLVDNINWELMGQTIGAGINTIVNTLTQLIEGIDWINLGSKFSQGLKGLVDEINFENLGKLLGDKFMISWEILNGFITDMSKKNDAGLNGWQQLGDALGDAVNGLNDAIDFELIGDTIAQGINGLADLIISFTEKVRWGDIAKNIYNGINKMINEIEWDKLGVALGKLFNNLLHTLVEIIEGIEWTNLGSKLSQGLRKFVNEVNWEDFGKLLGDTFMIGWEIFNGFITDMAQKNDAGLNGWQQLGDALGDAVNGLNDTIDFELIGDTIAQGINGLADLIISFTEKVRWGDIAKNIYNGINKMINEIEWDKLGVALGKLFNDLLYTLTEIIANTKWKELGQKLMQGINSLIQEINWEQIGKFLSDSVKGILDLAIGALQEFDPALIFNSIAEFLSGIDWSGIVEKIFEFLGAAFEKTSEALVYIGDALVKALDDVIKYFGDKIQECGGNIVLGILKGISDALAGIGNWIKEHIFEPFIKGFKSAFGIHSPSTVMAEQGKFIMEGLLNGISSLIQKVVDVFTDIKEKVIGAWNNLKENTTQLWQNISSEIGQTWDNLKNVASEKFEAIKESISNAWNNVKTITDEVWNGISEKVKDIWGNLKEFASEKFEAVKETISNAWNNLKSSTEETWNGISDKAKETWDNLKNVASEKFEAVKETVSNAWNNLKSSTEETWNSISDKTKATWDNLKSLASEKFESVKESVSNTWNNLKESTNDVWSNVKSTTENVWNNLKTGANDKFSTIKNYVVNAWQSIKQDTSRSWSEIEKAVKGVISNIINVFKEVPSKFVSFGKDIANGVVNGIKNTASSVTSSVRSFAGNVVSTFKSSLGIHSPSKVMAEQGEYVVAGLIQGMKETNPITNWATNIAKELQQTIGNTETWLSDKGKGIIQGFLDGITENGGKINNWFSSLGDQIDEVIPDMSESGKNLFENFISQFKSANISIPNLNLSNAVAALDINTNLSPANMDEFISPLEDPSIISRVNNSSKNYSNSRSSNINEDIKQAVIQGMMEVFMATRENNNQNNAPTIEFTWKTDSETLYKTVQKGKLKSDRRFNVVSEF